MHIGTIRHVTNGVTASLNCDLPSTLATRRYACGLEPAQYPVPAIPYMFRVSKQGRWATVQDWHLKVYRWWHKRANGEYGTGID